MGANHHISVKPQAISRDILRQKYGAPGETDADAVRRRVARALARWERDPERWEGMFLDAQTDGFIPGGRIMAGAGTGLETALINCFVQPVGDSVSARDDGRPGIYAALQQAAETLRRGGGVGYDFSALRPRGALVHSTRSAASGPVSYMRVFDRSCETVESAGARRGAQMGMLRVDHPDIQDFIHAKDHPGELENFNLSVSASDEFLQAVGKEADIELVHGAEPTADRVRAGAYRRDDGLWVYRRLQARELFDDLLERSYRYGDPGVVFIDTVNRENNLHYVESVEATNPCAEQPLPPYGCCCLGAIDLSRFVREPFTDRASFDFAAFARPIPVAVRMLDTVLDATYWPLAEQEQEARLKRRIGLGFTGLGDALVMLGLRYDSDGARKTAAAIARQLRDAAYWASVALAREKGPFPLFDAEHYGASPYIRRLPDALQEAVRAHGVRNSHLLSIAPTGTISLAFADNVSNGIEPAYAWSYQRRVRSATGQTRDYPVEDHAFRLYQARFGAHAPLSPAFVSALEVGVGGHMAMVAAVTPYIDAGISKTVNVAADYPFTEFEDLYLEAWRLGLKALSTFRPNPTRGAVLSTEGAGPSPETGVCCPQCGRPGLQRIDGCNYCAGCGFDGACG
jgi:ribonucleoside-diphosphate reductase alpha chain